jgi:hypothetical protein
MAVTTRMQPIDGEGATEDSHDGTNAAQRSHRSDFMAAKKAAGTLPKTGWQSFIDDPVGHIRDWSWRQKPSTTTQTSVGQAFKRGALSAIAPIEPLPELLGSDAAWLQRQAGLRSGKITPGFIEKLFPQQALRGFGRSAGRLLGKWLGPAILTYRLGTETKGKGILGGIDAGVRIVGEETIRTGFGIAGGVAGAKIGLALGSFFGPGIGNLVGGAVGYVAGYAIGEYGAKVWNQAVDTVQAPYRMARAGWKFLQSTSDTRLELGGGISAGNRTAAAATMRQRALGQMNRSGINMRSLLGQEAAYMHIR